MTDWDDEILIGEGVALNSGAAPVTMRMGSGAIDALVYLIPFSVLSGYVFEAVAFLNTALQTAAGIVWVALMLIVVPATVETLTRGRSAGRIALGLRIVRDDGGPVAFRHALARAVLALVEVYVSAGIIAITTAMLSMRGKRLGDFVSGTYAMRTRGVQTALPPISVPPGLREWATNADMRRLPDGLALTARMFVARAPMMHIPARARLGTQLVAEFQKYVAPLPPTGTHPETFLTAVLAARRDREYAYEWRRIQALQRESRALRALPYEIADADN